MFLLGIGLGRSKGSILNHIFLGITALILTSAVAHASDGEDLLNAAYDGDLAQVRTLLEKGTDIDHRSSAGVTALIQASQKGHEGIVQALLARPLWGFGALRVEIDHQAENGMTALYIASQNGHEGIVQALLAKGAEINHQAKSGSTALFMASQNGHGRIVQALLAEGAEINHQKKNGFTALIIASQNGHEGIVQALLARSLWGFGPLRVEIDHQAKNGVTALFIAAYHGHQGIVKALLAEGANVELRENGGGTALKHAKTQQIKQLLRAAGATQ